MLRFLHFPVSDHAMVEHSAVDRIVVGLSPARGVKWKPVSGYIMYPHGCAHKEFIEMTE